MDNYDKVKEHLLELEVDILEENKEEETFIISNTEEGIDHMILMIDDPILVLEQHLFNIQDGSEEIYQSLLKKNRDIVHGAFCVDDSGKKVLFRDTLQVESLDLNELEGSINSLSMLLSEYSGELLEFSKA